MHQVNVKIVWLTYRAVYLDAEKFLDAQWLNLPILLQ